MDDLHEAEGMLSDIAGSGRIAVLGRSFAYVLHAPVIRSVECGDFQVAGLRRKRVGDARTWQAYTVSVAKVLYAGKGRLIVQDTRGQVLTLTAPAYAAEPYSESEQGE